MSQYRYANGVEIYACGFDPPADFLDKALAYVIKVAPTRFRSRIRAIYIYERYCEHFTLYQIRYEVVMSAGDTITKKDLGLED